MQLVTQNWSAFDPVLGATCSFYVNDLPFRPNKPHVTTYANDTAVSFFSDKIEEINTLFNAELAFIENWLLVKKFH